MRCMICNWPMAQTRFQSGEYKVFECPKCHREKRKTLAKTDGAYSGRVVINRAIPGLTRQERG